MPSNKIERVYVNVFVFISSFKNKKNKKTIIQANKGKTEYYVTAHKVSNFVRFIFQTVFLSYAFVLKCSFVRWKKSHSGTDSKLHLDVHFNLLYFNFSLFMKLLTSFMVYLDSLLPSASNEDLPTYLRGALAL